MRAVFSPRGRSAGDSTLEFLFYYMSPSTLYTKVRARVEWEQYEYKGERWEAAPRARGRNGEERENKTKRRGGRNEIVQ